MIDPAYLTGQRIGDLITSQWPEVRQGGLLIEPNKLAGSIGAKVLIEWTPKLEEVVSGLKGVNEHHIRFMLVTQDRRALPLPASESPD